MKDNEDYLWDRTGQPDPEIQQLEEVLGTLRYQPRPLVIPDAVQVEHPPTFLRGLAPRLAIAATIALLLLGLGVWVGLQRFQREQPVAVTPPSSPAVGGNPAPTRLPEQNATASPAPRQEDIETPKRELVNPPVLAGYRSRPRGQARNASLKNRLLAAQQEKAAEAAKDQLMLALRVISAKLNYAQKKAQNPNPPDLIHNQHKIG